MALFQRLLTLHHSTNSDEGRSTTRTEDFFTEVVAAALRHDRSLFQRWLEFLFADYKIPGGATVSVTTQAGFGPRNRVDLVLKIEHEGFLDVFFIESKVGSQEGEDQLLRYTQVLENLTARNRYLVYITRRYDPKPAPKSSTVIFRCTRWFEFYRIVKGAHMDPLQRELTQFMETQGMAQNDRLMPIDLLVFGNLQRTLSALSSVLDSIPDGTVFKGQESPRQLAHRFLATQGRLGYQWEWGTLGTAVAYGFAPAVSPDPAAPPVAHVTLYVGPEAPQRAELRAAMLASTRAGEWESVDLEEGVAWFGMQKSRGLDTFAQSDNQRTELETFFRSELRRIEDWIGAHPQLTISQRSVNGQGQ